MGSKKHKKHKSDKRDKYEDRESADKPLALKLILKVGSSSTPEHSSDSPGPAVPSNHSNYSVAPSAGDEESRHSNASLYGKEDSNQEKLHRKVKKKKKKKEKDKDREKHEKKHKHHHKDKRKRPRDESSQDDVSLGEESLPEAPSFKRSYIENTPTKLSNGDHGVTNTDSSRHSHHQTGSHLREQRTCVLRQRQEKTALQKLLDYLLKSLEKRDPQQFFAWPVTDHIAPGYSHIINHPMDFSTMKQKLDDNHYITLSDFVDDFRLMCNNAMTYNHPETVYYKAAKKLLYVGVKMTQPEKLKPLIGILTYMSELTKEELGFDLGIIKEDVNLNSSATGPLAPGAVKVENIEEEEVANSDNFNEEGKEIKRLNDLKLLGKFEAIPDDLTPEEILEQAQKAAQAAADRLSMKRVNKNMGFLRQRKDGSTSLAILVPNEGVTPGTNERPVSLGTLTGKLTHGTGQLQGFREDKRNLSKTVKPLYYGAFGSYAPSYDSTFANLTKEESDLVYQTYGDETSVQYAESILDFTKDCDFTLKMVDDLLDLLTGGEHCKTKLYLEERKKLKEEEEKIRQMLEGESKSKNSILPIHSDKEINVDVNCLKSLEDIGIDIKFMDGFEEVNSGKQAEDDQIGDEVVQAQLDRTSDMIQQLQQVQNDRLSLTPPPHLAHIAQPSDHELQLAGKITESLTEITKKVAPGDVAPVASIRKAMGINPPTPECHTPSSLDGKSTLDSIGPDEVNVVSPQEEGKDKDVPDLESELREFLESEPALSNSPLHDDKTIEEILSES